jgi:three-Cys-motif partner protein
MGWPLGCMTAPQTTMGARVAKALPTIWTLEEHTRAKHELLTRYLSRWVPIFQHGYGKTGDLVLIDGFAGPGVYAGGEPGSPVLMVRQYLNAPRDPSTLLHCFFIEEDPKRVVELERRVGGFRGPNCHVEVLSGNYASHYARVMAYVDRLDDPAVFAFLDPFSAVEDPDLAIDVVVRPRSEVLVYLPVGHFARFIDQPSMERTLDGVYGDDRWKVLRGKSTARITNGLIELYAQRLAEPSAAQQGRFYVEWFGIQPAKGERYYLFLATKHRKAVEAIRDAMWAVDPANGRLFDARQSPQAGLDVWKPGLAAALRSRFPKGSRFDFEDAWDYVVDEQSPFDKPRLRAALALLRDTGCLEIRSPKTGKPSRRGFPHGQPITMLE